MFDSRFVVCLLVVDRITTSARAVSRAEYYEARETEARGTSNAGAKRRVAQSVGEVCGLRSRCCAVLFPGGLKGRDPLAFIWSPQRPLSEANVVSKVMSLSDRESEADRWEARRRSASKSERGTA